MNPYEYTQVNVREQCSWVHRDDEDAATDKALGLVRAGIARTRLYHPLEPIVVETTPKTLVIGGGIAGLRAAIGLADIGLQVVLVERELTLGGWVGRFGEMYPHGRNGRELIARLVAEVKRRPAITVLTGAEVVAKSGSFGNYVGRRARRRAGRGVDPGPRRLDRRRHRLRHLPAGGRRARLRHRRRAHAARVQGAARRARRARCAYNGRPVRSIAYVYCVGSRQPADGNGANEYCSRYCCTAAVHASIQASRLDATVRQYHLYRDMRTYGKYETLYTEARKTGSVYLKFPDDEPPAVAAGAGRPAGRHRPRPPDRRRGAGDPGRPRRPGHGHGPARRTRSWSATLKLPLGSDGFFNEIHPKLRPVETVVDGVLIAGACQGPKTSAESVASGLAAVTQSAAILRKGYAELDPLVAVVDADACTACGECLTACPYDAISMAASRRPRRSRPSARPAARAAAAASRSARTTPSTCAATPTPRSGP